MEAQSHNFGFPVWPPGPLDQFSAVWDDTHPTLASSQQTDEHWTGTMAPDSRHQTHEFFEDSQQAPYTQHTSNQLILDASVHSDWGDGIGSPSTEASTFTTPSAPWETPRLSPNPVFSPLFPRLYSEPDPGSMDQMAPTEDTAGRIPLSTGDPVQVDLDPDVCEALDNLISNAADLTMPPTQTTGAPSGSLTMEDRPPWIPAREWRNMIKPVKCPGCSMEFTYDGERDKHILSIHPDLAPEYNISTQKHPCPIPGCPKMYKRKDYVPRHLTNKHGREKTRRGRGRKQQGGRVGGIT